MLSQYPADAEVVWAQEEPENQGGWPFMHSNLPEHLDGRALRVVARAASAATATGLKSIHDKEQAELLDRVFDR